MKAKFGKNKEYRQVYSLPPVGNFAFAAEGSKAIAWEHCRENFAAKFDQDTTGFFFSIHPDSATDVAEFLAKCEGIIGVEPSTFRKTSKNTVLWVEPSVFWRECGLRRSLLTAFLRSGLNYNAVGDNFDDALFSENYAENKWLRETREATLRFLFGFTNWEDKNRRDSGYGWHSEFKNTKADYIRQKLTSDKREFFIVGLESLWA